MKKGIALLVTVGLLAGMTVPVSAAEQISTYKGDQELILDEAGDVDLTKEELLKKSKDIMENAQDRTLFMNMDLEASMAYEEEGTKMSMDLGMMMEMTDNKNGDLEYISNKSNMSFYGMDVTEETEEYIFPNADGKKVSVKKETSTESEDENSGTWVAEAVEEEEEAETIEEDFAEASTMDSFLSDDLYQSFELLDKMYTDGEKNYYVMKAKTSDVMGSGFGDFQEMFGDIEVDGDCYIVFAEDGMLETLYVDMSSIVGQVIEQDGVETTISKFQISGYTNVSEDIVIPEEVQTAGDAAA